jgi:aspartate aminotransferase
LSSNVSNISQRAALAALTGDQQPVKDMLAAFDRRRQLAVSEMNKVPGVVTPTPKGAFYIYSDVSGLLGKSWGGKQINSSLELCDYALDAAEVAMVPGEAFGPSGYVRLSYALGDDQLVAGIQRLQKLFS